MRTYRCLCGNALFFDNSLCLACGRELGFCPVCRNLNALLPSDGDSYQCANPDCGATLVKCLNYTQYQVCNRCIVPPGDPTSATSALCDCCRFNQTIPDLTVPGNISRWYRLEAAKRRLFYDLGQLGLPYGTKEDGIEPCLGFDFKADAIPVDGYWRNLPKTEKVYTGHANGLITINIREADDVEREKLRVDMGEAQRTLIGHFRHEIGHFYWDVLVKGRREDEFQAAFGDHNNPTYSDALDTHYKNGPPLDWSTRFISAYASMHPWEDFAETWATYLDMVSTLDTAYHMGFGGEADPINADLNAMIVRYQRLGIAMNEMNRSVGLLDVVPEIFVRPVIEKLQFVHGLVLAGRAENKIFLPAEETSPPLESGASATTA
jgi:hypothetical protein